MVVTNNKWFNKKDGEQAFHPCLMSQIGPLETAEVRRGIETQVKVLQTSRQFFHRTREFLSNSAKVRSRLTNSYAADFCRLFRSGGHIVLRVLDCEPIAVASWVNCVAFPLGSVNLVTRLSKS